MVVTPLFSDKTSRPSSIDPLALLTAHQEGRDRGTRIISTLCGFSGVARATWGRWLVQHQGESHPAAQGTPLCVIPPGPTEADLRRALASRSRAPDFPLLLVPETEAFGEALAALYRLADAAPSRPVGLITGPTGVMNFLQDAAEGSEDRSVLRQALVGGLVVLDQHVEETLNGTVLRRDERPLYRSDHEQILHKLLVHDAGVSEAIRSNQRVRGGSGKRYEVDLWCEPLRLALEVDGGQHVSRDKQRRKDAERDTDLAAVGIATVRVHAAEVMGDPTRVLAYVRSRIETRRQEITP